MTTIAISSGDPAGIGPEVTLKALADRAVRALGRFVVVGGAAVLADTASRLGLPALPSLLVDERLRAVVDAAAEERAPGCNSAIDGLQDYVPASVTDGAAVLDVGTGEEKVPVGERSPVAGRAAARFIRVAAGLCLCGAADALVTGPVNKEAVAESGLAFTGHTEYLAELCGARETRMLLANDRMRVVHVTTHCALRAATQVTIDRIARTIALGHDAMRQLGCAQPRIAVCGLNPHAGEHGLFGQEEQQTIEPAIRQSREAGVPCAGPFAADTLFLSAARGEWDLVVAMYHDQGHIPMKLLDFERTVNVTLGLPIVRTSVDHGTAYDIAGRGIASAESMKAAIRLAVELCGASSVPLN